VYVEFLQWRRSLETNDANQSASGQIKRRLIHRDSLLLDDAAFIRCLDEKVLGHEIKVKVGGARSVWSLLRLFESEMLPTLAFGRSTAR
jgi:hypothetical protein